LAEGTNRLTSLQDESKQTALFDGRLCVFVDIEIFVNALKTKIDF